MADERDRERKENEREREENEREREETDRERRERNNEPEEARGEGKSPINITSIMEPATHGHFWLWFILLLIALGLANYFNKIRLSLLFIGGIFFVVFIFWGVHLGFSKRDSDHTETFIALALLIWLLDLMPANTWLIGPFLGAPYAGFEFSKDILFQTNWFGIITSGVSLVFWYLNMVYKIIKKEWLNFGIIFFFILITHSLLVRYFPNTTLTIPFSVGFPYAKIILFAVAGFLLWLGYHFDKKAFQTAIPDFFTSLFMITVFSFFLINNGWMNNTRAWMHMVFTLAFGFGYVFKKHKTNPIARNILIPLILILDFFGYGLLWSGDYLYLKFIPIIVLIVIVYCYTITEGNNYAIAAFIFLVTFILIMSIQVYGFNTSGLSVRDAFKDKQKQGNDFRQFTTEVSRGFTNFLEGRLELATGGLYKSQVEKNQYEPLGVFFDNVRVAQPKFYTSEPATIWATVKSRTLSDPVKVDFSCYDIKDNKREKLNSGVQPDRPFTISTFEETDVECKYPPFTLESGTNLIALSLKYNFETDAYQKIYLIDKERLRSMARENLDPFNEFGITDKNPVAIYTNGPVEIGVDITNLITVPRQGDASYNPPPLLGISLNNRNKITDKQGQPVGQWEGRIKEITELAIVMPPDITINLNDAGQSTDCNPIEFTTYDKAECRTSCERICTQNTGVGQERNDCNRRCSEQCDSLFKDESAEAGRSYNGYKLDTTKIANNADYKDFDRYKTFSCRLIVDKNILENIPITTKFIRIKARYEYSIDKPFNILVEQTPATIAAQSNYILSKYASEAGVPPNIIKAIALVESSAQHCNDGSNNCLQDKVRLGDSGTSIGIMQIHFPPHPIKWKTDASEVCQRKPDGTPFTVYDFTCNVKLGIEILKGYYSQYKDGNSDLEGSCPKSDTDYEQYNAYRDWSAALRAYNGWGCGSGVNTRYVESVIDVVQQIERGTITAEVGGRFQEIDNAR